jgi:sialate O-acetylesterase
MAAQHRPSHLYNGMIHPLLPVPIKGVTWYQGESNAIGDGAVEGYAQLLPVMIADWRDAWGQQGLPFLMVQLANWNHPDDGWDFPGAREVQRRVHATTPGTGLAVIIDIGAAHDIHPRNKHDVGERLARWALADVYGDDGIVASGPLFSHVIVQDHDLRIAFETFGSDVAVRGTSGAAGTPVHGFEVAGLDGVFHRASAELDGSDVVIVHLPSKVVSPPYGVRYAWAPDPTDADLINAVGLPASGFLEDALGDNPGNR